MTRRQRKRLRERMARAFDVPVRVLRHGPSLGKELARARRVFLREMLAAVLAAKESRTRA